MTRRLPWPAPILAAGLAAPVAALAGGLIATTHYGRLLDILLGLAIVLPLLLLRWGVGVAVGLLVLGGLNALPGPNLQTTHVALTFTAQAVDVVVLIGLLFVIGSRHRRERPPMTAIERRIMWWAFAFLAVWLFTVGRTVVSTPVSIRRALYWCMDFAFFAALVPLFARAFHDAAMRRICIVTVAIGTVISALAQSFIVISHSQLTFILHTTQVETLQGLPRLYTGAIDLPFAALPLAVGGALFGATPRYRKLSAIVALICVVSVALALTRARYVGQTVGLACAALLWLCVSDKASRLARVRFSRALVAIVVTVLLLVLVNPSVLGSTELNTVTSRVNSATEVVTGQSSTATIDVRLIEVRRLEQVLGGRWLFGMGFLDPSSDFVTGLPQGSIRNSDVGYLNMVMTMGVFGLVIYVAPLVLLALATIRWRLSRTRAAEVEWIAFGGFAYVIATLVSSATLVILFSTTGVVAAAGVVGLLVRALSTPAVSESAEPEPTDEPPRALALAGAA